MKMSGCQSFFSKDGGRTMNSPVTDDDLEKCDSRESFHEILKLNSAVISSPISFISRKFIMITLIFTSTGPSEIKLKRSQFAEIKSVKVK